jgi:hypothetical protein
MNTKQAGGVAVSGHPPSPSRPRQFCDFTRNAIRHVPRVAIQEFARPSSAMVCRSRFWFSSEAVVNDRAYSPESAHLYSRGRQ